MKHSGIRRQLQTRPSPLLGLLYCRRLNMRRSATGRTAAWHVGSLVSCLLQDGDGRSLADDNDGLRSTGDHVLAVLRHSRPNMWNCILVRIFHHLLHSLFFSGQYYVDIIVQFSYQCCQVSNSLFFWPRPWSSRPWPWPWPGASNIGLFARYVVNMNHNSDIGLSDNNDCQLVKISTVLVVLFISVYLKPMSQLRFDYDTTIPRRIRLRRKWSKLRCAFDSTAIRLQYNWDEKLTCSFFVRVESRRKEAGARDTS